MLKKIYYTLLSMLVVFKHLFMKPVTLEYPEKKNKTTDNFRGKPVVNGCQKCGVCIRVCPTGAISISDDEFKIDLKKCIFCGNCAFYCTQNAIKMSESYELATDNVKDLSLVYKISGLEGDNDRNK